MSAIVAGPPADIFLCAAPLLCLVSALVSLKLERGSRSAALAGFGVLGVLTSYRRVLFLADAPYVGPPILFALVCAAGCLSVAVSRRPAESRPRLSAAVLSGVASLAAVLFALRVFRVCDGRPDSDPRDGGMLSARGETARQIEAVADRVRRETAGGGSLAVFPEGEILNFLSGRTNPIRHKLYLPGYVSAANEAEILSELVRARPAAVVIWPRQLAEYGGRQFGVDYARTISRLDRARVHARRSRPEWAGRGDPETGSGTLKRTHCSNMESLCPREHACARPLAKSPLPGSCAYFDGMDR